MLGWLEKNQNRKMYDRKTALTFIQGRLTLMGKTLIFFCHLSFCPPYFRQY